jgi:cysteine desulfurase
MQPFLVENYGNPSSQYSHGFKVRNAIEKSRKQIANAINAVPSEIIFTSGGSEANSWVLRSVVEAYFNKPIHIITSSIEHHSVINTCYALERLGIEVTYLPVNSLGQVIVSDVKAAIKINTKLVSIMLANNEIGTIQPISEIGQYLKETDILFHTDAVQAVGHIPVNVNDLHVNFLTASAHKFNGAKGTGFLFIKNGTVLPPLVFGGEQERGLRAGTENSAGIVSAGYAIEESVNEIVDTTTRLQKIVNYTINGIKSKISSVLVNGQTGLCLPGIVNFVFDGVTGDSLMHILDLKGICVSTSSACSSGKNEPSHVLLALGLTEKQAKSAIRISYGRFNTYNEAEIIVKAIYEAYKLIRDST